MTTSNAMAFREPLEYPGGVLVFLVEQGEHVHLVRRRGDGETEHLGTMTRSGAQRLGQALTEAAFRLPS